MQLGGRIIIVFVVVTFAIIITSVFLVTDYYCQPNEFNIL